MFSCSPPNCSPPAGVCAGRPDARALQAGGRAAVSPRCAAAARCNPCPLHARPPPPPRSEMATPTHSRQPMSLLWCRRRGPRLHSDGRVWRRRRRRRAGRRRRLQLHQPSGPHARQPAALHALAVAVSAAWSGGGAACAVAAAVWPHCAACLACCVESVTSCVMQQRHGPVSAEQEHAEQEHAEQEQGAGTGLRQEGASRQKRAQGARRREGGSQGGGTQHGYMSPRPPPITVTFSSRSTYSTKAAARASPHIHCRSARLKVPTSSGMS